KETRKPARLFLNLAIVEQPWNALKLPGLQWNDTDSLTIERSCIQALSIVHPSVFCLRWLSQTTDRQRLP
ncbi:MAG: hypothetical protein WBD47_20835, partial [Phormidesmis sp.]